jgi:hypothetical protein
MFYLQSILLPVQIIIETNVDCFEKQSTPT